ncbi:MAG: PilN domain-containing protein [Planctomycetota bacterium]
MTTSPTTTRNVPAPIATAVAGLVHRGQTWHLAIVAPPAGPGSLPRVISARALSPAELTGRGERLGAILSDAGVGLLVKVAPGAECYAKLTPAPEVPQSGLAPAISLLAEANLPEDLPRHRRASGIVRTPSGTAALFTGWRGTGSDDLADGIDEFWIAEPAALVGLMSTRSGFAASWDSTRGSIVIAATGGESGVVRCMRGDRSTPEAFAQSLAGAVRSTASATGGAASGLSLDPEDRPVGLSIGDGWSLADVCVIETGARSGADTAILAIGAALSVLNQASGSPSLAGLRSEHDGGPDPKLIRAANWLGKPGVAVKVVAAAVAVAVFAPIGLSWARLAVVNSKADALIAAKSEGEKLNKSAALYSQLDAKRWPMTKLLAQVSNACPVGVEIDSLTIESEGSQTLLLKGIADSSEILSKLTKNLNDTGLFGSVGTPDTKADSQGLNFSIQAKVTNARNASAPIDDFAKKTLRERLYADGGKGPATTTHVAAADPPPDDTGEVSVETPKNPSAGGNNRRNNGRTVRGETAVSVEANKAKGTEVPDVLSDEQIGAMTSSALTIAWAKHKAALSKSDLDPTVRSRLEAQLAKIDAKRSGGNK